MRRAAGRKTYAESDDSISDDDGAPKAKSPNPLGIIRRRRGRPRGNPKPLDAEQRRMRNAELERLRRHEIGEAYRELHNVITNADASDEDDISAELSRMKLIEKTIHFLNKYRPTKEEIEAENNKLEKMIKEFGKADKIDWKNKRLVKPTMLG